MPIIQYWHDESIPEEIEVLLATFRENNPDLRHLVFSEASADAFIAQHFSPREVKAFRACAVPAMQADYFRLCAVYVLGGMWIDADARCVAPLKSVMEPEDGELFSYRGGRAVANGCFVFRLPGHPLLRLALDVATANIESRISERIDFVTGPGIFTMLIESQELGSFEAWLADGLEALREPICGNPQHVELLCTMIEDAREAGAFRGVRVSPQRKLNNLIEHPAANLGYKDSTYHSGFQGNIYRSPDA